MKRRSGMEIIGIVLLGLLFTNVTAMEKIKAGAPSIPVMCETENKGIIIDLLHAIAKKGDMDIEIKIYPAKRLVTRFFEGQLDMIFPAVSGVFGDRISDVLPSKEIIFMRKTYIFTKKGQALLKTISQLEGKKVGLIRGFPYLPELTNNQKIKIDLANSGVINVKKLQAGRFDAIAMEEKSALGAINEVGADIQYDQSAPISEEAVFFSFHNNDKGKELEDKFSKVFLELKKNGTFGKIMGKAH